MKVKSEGEVAQSCPTVSDPMDYSLPGSSVRYPGSIPGQRIKILLHATTHCCLREIRYSQIIHLFNECLAGTMCRTLFYIPEEQEKASAFRVTHSLEGKRAK